MNLPLQVGSPLSCQSDVPIRDTGSWGQDAPAILIILMHPILIVDESDA